ncbi:hypothetical protein QBC34DRAFT_397702 [Podospora aff. communis PSN243]|uniref:Uncharacterized protein n=1 Tax=Podospora aff. communis PSN243 TaxID=3040156 RepID=A0AAV9GYZ0_9PEZI|nr:hypothetical protein QBC34DRAFT_397702 [Podospora aff. communis PSN243]
MIVSCFPVTLALGAQPAQLGRQTLKGVRLIAAPTSCLAPPAEPLERAFCVSCSCRKRRARAGQRLGESRVPAQGCVTLKRHSASFAVPNVRTRKWLLQSTRRVGSASVIWRSASTEERRRASEDKKEICFVDPRQVSIHSISFALISQVRMNSRPVSLVFPGTKNLQERASGYSDRRPLLLASELQSHLRMQKCELSACLWVSATLLAYRCRCQWSLQVSP